MVDVARGSCYCSRSWNYSTLVECELGGQLRRFLGYHRITSRWGRARSTSRPFMRMQNEEGIYVFYVYRLNLPVNATALTLGVPVEGTIEQLAEFEAYTFQVQAGDQIRIRMLDLNQSAGFAAMEPRLELLDAQGMLLDRQDGTTTVTIEFTAQATETFYLLASDAEQNEGGNYVLSVHRLNLKPTLSRSRRVRSDTDSNPLGLNQSAALATRDTATRNCWSASGHPPGSARTEPLGGAALIDYYGPCDGNVLPAGN